MTSFEIITGRSPACHILLAVRNTPRGLFPLTIPLAAMGPRRPHEAAPTPPRVPPFQSSPGSPEISPFGYRFTRLNVRAGLATAEAISGGPATPRFSRLHPRLPSPWRWTL